jgi:threonine dehydratase
MNPVRIDDRPWHLCAPDFAEITAAAERIAAVCRITPLLESRTLNRRLGGRVLVKAEPLQHTGSFKLRGAYNRIVQLDTDERRRGVVAFSSGNHAQAVAYAAALLEVPAVIVMPSDAPQVKLERTRAHGAEVVIYDRYKEDRAAIAGRFVAERGLVLVPPYDDRRIVAGAGTLGREIALQARDAGAPLDALVVGCGGGGLTAGCALSMQALAPGAAVVTVEPQGFDDTARSLRAGERVSNAPEARSVCDALLVATPGELTFDVNRRLVTESLAVSDEEVVAAMRCAFEEFALVVEPGGCVALAALLAGRYAVRGRTVAATLTGGNVDMQWYAKVLAS